MQRPFLRARAIESACGVVNRRAVAVRERLELAGVRVVCETSQEHGDGKMDLLTPLDSYCRLIIRAREMEAQVPAQDPDEDPDNVDDTGDDDGGNAALSVLEDELNDIEEEMQALLEDLAEDQLAECLGLAWVGAGTFEASEWEDAYAEARELSDDDIIAELMGMGTLSANLESGLAAFEYSCDEVGQLD